MNIFRVGYFIVFSFAIATLCHAQQSNTDTSGPPPPTPPAFTVHEWGTFTTLAGSDGVLLPGLYHEEEYLPYFVYCFQGFSEGGYIHKGLSLECDNVTLKMETPVLYFYSDSALTANVRVDWPGGTISQWYPQRSDGEQLDTYTEPIDFSTQHNGWIDWNTNILAPSPDDTAGIWKPGESHIWDAPRATDANIVTDSVGDVEKFLFYRGVGNANFMTGATNGSYVLKTWFENGKLAIQNLTTTDIGYALVFDRSVDPVSNDSTNAVWWTGPIPAGSRVNCSAPSDASGMSFDAALNKFRSQLVAAGLYQKEANAMIDTWQQSYFGTPGLRIFWIVPRAMVDSSLPLTITPKPGEIERVMVARSEVLTPAFEQQLLADYNNDNFGQYYNDRYYLAYLARVQAMLAAGVSPSKSTDGITIYPNPTNGAFTVTGSVGSITVTNVLGQPVAQFGNWRTAIAPNGSGEVELDLSRMPAGTYFARIEAARGTIVRKIMKE